MYNQTTEEFITQFMPLTEHDVQRIASILNDAELDVADYSEYLGKEIPTVDYTYEFVRDYCVDYLIENDEPKDIVDAFNNIWVDPKQEFSYIIYKEDHEKLYDYYDENKEDMPPYVEYLLDNIL